MKRIASFLLLTALLCGCARDASEGGTAVKPPTQPDLAHLSAYSLGEPIVSGNATFIPIATRRVEELPDDYISLTEAKKNGWIEITELDEEGEVSQLRVRNTGTMPILLLGGELLLGGKQDRVVVKDTIVPPGKAILVEVFCVEPGRWSGSGKFEAADAHVPSTVKAAAAFGTQSMVWAKVGEFNEKAGARSSRTTVQSGLASPKIQQRIDDELAQVVARLKREPNVVGVMFLLNGEIQSLELFGSPDLLAGSLEGLIRGFLAEASVEPDLRKPLDTAHAETFLQRVVGAERQWDVTRSRSIATVDLGLYQGREIAAPGGEDAPLIHGSYVRSPNE